MLPSGADDNHARWQIRVGDTVTFIRHRPLDESETSWKQWRISTIGPERFDDHESAVLFIGKIEKIFVGNLSSRGFLIDENDEPISLTEGWSPKGCDALIMERGSVYLLDSEGAKRVDSIKMWDPNEKKTIGGDNLYMVQRKDVVSKKKCPMWGSNPRPLA